MNQVAKEILNSIVSIQDIDSSSFVSRIKFLESFVGFKGHFTDQPVLPAICMFEMVKCLLNKKNGCVFGIQEVILAKFYNVISVREYVDIKIEELKELENCTYIYKVEITRGDIKKAVLKLKVKKQSIIKADEL